MAQLIKIVKIEVKEGDNARGHWRNFILTGEDGTKVSTFDTSASSLKEGDTLEAEIELKGKFANLKTFKMIEKALEKTPEPHQLGGNARDESIERQVAAKIVGELLTAKIIGLDHTLAKGVIKWLSNKLDVNDLRGEKPTEPPKPVPETPQSTPSPAKAESKVEVPPEVATLGEEVKKKVEGDSNVNQQWLEENWVKLAMPDKRAIRAWTVSKVAIKSEKIADMAAQLNQVDALLFVERVQKCVN